MFTIPLQITILAFLIAFIIYFVLYKVGAFNKIGNSINKEVDNIKKEHKKGDGINE